MYDYRGEKYDLAGLKEAMRERIASEQRVRINNILISEDWMAIHFWNVETEADGSKDAFNHMQFLHFVETDDGLKVDMCWQSNKRNRISVTPFSLLCLYHGDRNSEKWRK